MSDTKCKIMWGLRIVGTRNLLTYYTNINSGEFCCDTSYTLSTNDEDVWLTPYKDCAERVSKTNTEWYNAGKESPEHGYGVKGKELEVVRVEWRW